jgi:hypothetical protein
MSDQCPLGFPSLESLSRPGGRQGVGLFFLSYQCLIGFPSWESLSRPGGRQGVDLFLPVISMSHRVPLPGGVRGGSVLPVISMSHRVPLPGGVRGGSIFHNPIFYHP